MAHILVVDDEPDIRSLVCTFLDGEGHTTSEAEDGEEGLRAAEEKLPDLVISDISMPGMTGFDFLGGLRKNPATAAVPVIFITGVKEKNAMRRGMELGADDFLEKPFTSSALLTAVRTRLKMREMVRERSEQKLEQLRQSIALSLPHELRTPLNSILAFSQIIHEDTETLTKDELKNFSLSIHQAGTRLHRLIENYLLYADAEIAFADETIRGELAKQVTPNTHRVVRSYSQDKAKEYDRANDLVFETDDVSLNMQHDHFARIVTEVVDNALKFSQKEKKITIHLKEDGDRVRFSVTDKGSGMKPEHVEALGAFVQFDRKVREQQGSGLGLTIVRKLAQLYGGTVVIESEHGKGTTVTVDMRKVSEA